MNEQSDSRRRQVMMTSLTGSSRTKLLAALLISSVTVSLHYLSRCDRDQGHVDTSVTTVSIHGNLRPLQLPYDALVLQLLLLRCA